PTLLFWLPQILVLGTVVFVWSTLRRQNRAGQSAEAHKGMTPFLAASFIFSSFVIAFSLTGILEHYFMR
ncbi:MAG: hypothetical protein ACYDGM_14275, partial [Vulcanimicrobiaceae bacterium]